MSLRVGGRARSDHGPQPDGSSRGGSTWPLPRHRFDAATTRPPPGPAVERELVAAGQSLSTAYCYLLHDLRHLMNYVLVMCILDRPRSENWHSEHISGHYSDRVARWLAPKSYNQSSATVRLLSHLLSLCLISYLDLSPCTRHSVPAAIQRGHRHTLSES